MPWTPLVLELRALSLRELRRLWELSVEEDEATAFDGPLGERDFSEVLQVFDCSLTCSTMVSSSLDL